MSCCGRIPLSKLILFPRRSTAEYSHLYFPSLSSVPSKLSLDFFTVWREWIFQVMKRKMDEFLLLYNSCRRSRGFVPISERCNHAKIIMWFLRVLDLLHFCFWYCLLLIAEKVRITVSFHGNDESLICLPQWGLLHRYSLIFFRTISCYLL